MTRIIRTQTRVSSHLSFITCKYVIEVRHNITQTNLVLEARFTTLHQAFTISEFNTSHVVWATRLYSRTSWDTTVLATPRSTDFSSPRLAVEVRRRIWDVGLFSNSPWVFRVLSLPLKSYQYRTRATFLYNLSDKPLLSRGKGGGAYGPLTIFITGVYQPFICIIRYT